MVEDHALAATAFRLALETPPQLGRVIVGVRPEVFKPVAPSEDFPK